MNCALAEHLECHMNAHPGLYHNIASHTSDRVSAVTSGTPEPGALFLCCNTSAVGGDYLRGVELKTSSLSPGAYWRQLTAPIAKAYRIQPASSCWEMHLNWGISSARAAAPAAHTAAQLQRNNSQGKSIERVRKSQFFIFHQFCISQQMWKNHLLLKKSSIPKQDFLFLLQYVPKTVHWWCSLSLVCTAITNPQNAGKPPV